MVSTYWKDDWGERMGMFVNMEEGSDVIVRFGDDSAHCKLYCHYFILALQSEVFRRRKYTWEGGKRVISYTHREERDQTIISDVIVSLYNGTLLVDESNFDVVYAFAFEHKIHWIEKHARQEMHKFISKSSVLWLLNLSDEIKCRLLRDEVVKYLKTCNIRHVTDFLPKETLLATPPHVLSTILEATKKSEQRNETVTLDVILQFMGKNTVRLEFAKSLLSCIAWEKLANTEVEVERLGDRLKEELLPFLSEPNKRYLIDKIQDAMNYAACKSTMLTAQALFVTSRWDACPFEIAEYILSNDYIKVENEYVIAEAALTWIDNQAPSLTHTEVLSMLSSIRLDALHSRYIFTILQPHVSQYGVTQQDWHKICAKTHPRRKNIDEVVSGSVVLLPLSPKKEAKEFCSLKDGVYTLHTACSCSYLLETGPKQCLSVTVEVNVRLSPPVTLKRSQCRYCNRVVLHLYVQTPHITSKFPSLHCGNISTIRHTLKIPGIKVFVILSEAESRSEKIISDSWHSTTIKTVVWTLNNDNIKSLTEYQILEAGLSWLDNKLPDKTYFKTVLSCVKYSLLHEKYLKDTITNYIRTSYVMDSAVWKTIMKNGNAIRVHNKAASYHKIVKLPLPRAVVRLVEGEHVIRTECLCEPKSTHGTIEIGRLQVRFRIAITQIPALSVYGKCDKCNISISHAFLTSIVKFPYFPTLVNISIYRLKNIIESCLQFEFDSDSDDDSESQSYAGSEKKASPSSPNSINLSADMLCINLILKP